MLQAFGKFILIQPVEREEKTKSGIILANETREEQGKYYQGQGEVLSFGEEVTGLKKGALIRFKRHQEHVIEVEGEDELWLIPMDCVIAIEK